MIEQSNGRNKVGLLWEDKDEGRLEWKKNKPKIKEDKKEDKKTWKKRTSKWESFELRKFGKVYQKHTPRNVAEKLQKETRE